MTRAVIGISVAALLSATGIGVTRLMEAGSKDDCVWTEEERSASMPGLRGFADLVAESLEVGSQAAEVVSESSESEPTGPVSLIDDSACVSRRIVVFAGGRTVLVWVDVFSTFEQMNAHLQERTTLASDWRAQLGYPPDQRRSPLEGAELDVGGEEEVDFYCSYGLASCEKFVLFRRSAGCHAILIEEAIPVGPAGGDRAAIRDLLVMSSAQVASDLEQALSATPCASGPESLRAVEFALPD